MRSIIVLSFVALTLSVTIAAQRLPAPTTTSYLKVDGADNVLESGDVYVAPGSAVLTLSWRATEGTHGVATYTLPFDQVGSISNFYDGTLLVSGYSPGTAMGYVFRLALNSQANAITAFNTAQYPGIDPYQVAWNSLERALYLRTFSGKYYVYRASWLPTDSLPQSLASYTLMASDSSIPELRSAAYKLFPRPYAAGVALAAFEQGLGTKGVPRFHIDQSGHQSVTLYDVQGAADQGLAMNGYAFTSVAGPFLIKGPPGSIALRDLTTNAIVSHATLPIPAPGSQWWDRDDDVLSSWTSVVPSSALTPGHGYQWEHVATNRTSIPFYPIVRYGAPSTAALDSIQVAVNPGTLLSPYLQVDQIVGVSTEIGFAAPISRGLTAYLNAAFADSGGASDPVVALGNGDYLLQPQITIGPKAVQASGTQADILFPLILPNDSGFAGMRLLFQWLIVDDATGTILGTDVFGSHILPAPPAGSGGAASMMSSGTPGLPTSGGPSAGIFSYGGSGTTAALAALQANLGSQGVPLCSALERQALLVAVLNQLAVSGSLVLPF